MISKYLSGLFVCGLLALAACKKDKIQGNASLAVINATMGLGSLNLKADGGSLNTTAINYGSTSAGYYSLSGGLRNMSFVNGVGQTLKEGILTFDGGASYTLFMLDSNRTGQLSFYVLPESPATVSADSFALRVVNLSPDTLKMNVDLFLGTDSTRFAARYEYLGFGRDLTFYAKFYDKKPGTYTIKVRNNATGQLLVSLPAVVFKAGKVYTLYSFGKVGLAAYPFNIGIMENR